MNLGQNSIIRDKIIDYDVANMPDLTDLKMEADVPWIAFYNKEKGTYGAFGGNIFALKMGVPSDQKDKVVANTASSALPGTDHRGT